MARVIRSGGSPRLANTLPARIAAALAEQSVVLPGTQAFGTVLAGSAARLASVIADRKALAEQTDAMLEAHPFWPGPDLDARGQDPHRGDDSGGGA